MYNGFKLPKVLIRGNSFSVADDGKQFHKNKQKFLLKGFPVKNSDVFQSCGHVRFLLCSYWDGNVS